MFGSQNTVRGLTVAALAGLLLWQSASTRLGVEFIWSMLFCIVFVAALFATMFLMAPDGWRHLGRHPDLLVPLGMLAVALGLVDLLSGAKIGLQTAIFTVPLGFVEGFPVSVAWVLRILLHALFATWMTLLVVEAVRQDRADLGPALSRSKDRFLRVFALLCLIWILATLLYAVEIPVVLMLGMGIARVLGSFGVIVVWSALIGVLAYRFTISLATAALLPVAVESPQGFFPTLRRGIEESWRNRDRWWRLLLIQYLLVGAWIAVHYHYSQTGGPFSSNTSFKFNCNYLAPWLGDYDYAATWYSRVMGWLEHEPLAFLVTLSALLSGLLSIVVKLAIVERYTSALPGERPPDRQPPDPALLETLPGNPRDRQTPAGPPS